MTCVLAFYFLVSHAQIPEGYYADAEGKSGETLKTSLYNIIKGHVEFPYTASSTDTWDILKETDQDPDNPANVIGIYSAFSMDGEAEYNNGQGWNREHVWAKSRGDFGTSRGAGTDVHHLRAADISTNSARSNRTFAECNDPYFDQSGTYSGQTESFTSSEEFVWKPRAEVKGDVARMIFYMAVRYEGENGEPDLEIVDYILDQSSKEPLHGRLKELLNWHEEDPVDEYERRRNDIIYGYQDNRNPFIDHPEYVASIWGDDSSEPEEVTITSVPVNDATVDVEYVYDITASGGENDLAFTASNLPEWLSLTDNQNGTASLSGTPSSADTGVNTVEISVTDGITTDNQFFSIDVSEEAGTVINELFISEYIEGSSFNKAIEIANFTGEDVDLSSYSLRKQDNGAGEWSTGLALSGSLSSGEVYVIAHSSAASEILQEADVTTAVTEMSFNGNDPIALFKDDVLIDIIGTFNDTAYFGQDVTKERDPVVSSPNTTYDEGEWIDYELDTFMYLGYHTIENDAGNEKPVVTIESPLDSTSFFEGELITFVADAFDNDGSIAKVVFYEGNTILGEVTSEPYSFEWENAPVGNYLISAIAYDDQNGYNLSEAITILVNERENEILMQSGINFSSENSGDSYLATADVEITAEGSNLTDIYVEVIWNNSDSSYFERQALYTTEEGVSFTSTELEEDDFTFTITAVRKDGYFWDKENSQITASSGTVTSNTLNLKAATDIVFYPNPFDGTAYLELYIEKASDINLKIYDIRGVELKSYLYSATEGQNKFELGKNLKSGMYTVQVLIGNQLKAFKIIKD